MTNTKRDKFCKWLQKKIYKPKYGVPMAPLPIRVLWAVLHPLRWYVLDVQKFIRVDYSTAELVTGDTRKKLSDIVEFCHNMKKFNEETSDE